MGEERGDDFGDFWIGKILHVRGRCSATECGAWVEKLLPCPPRGGLSSAQYPFSLWVEHSARREIELEALKGRRNQGWRRDGHVICLGLLDQIVALLSLLFSFTHISLTHTSATKSSQQLCMSYTFMIHLAKHVFFVIYLRLWDMRPLVSA
jgi:hypothetical protein